MVFFYLVFFSQNSDNLFSFNKYLNIRIPKLYQEHFFVFFVIMDLSNLKESIYNKEKPNTCRITIPAAQNFGIKRISSFSLICAVYLSAFCYLLTLNLVNFLNGIVHLPFLELSIINFGDIKLRNWSVNSIKPSQTARMCRLAWLYTDDKG